MSELWFSIRNHAATIKGQYKQISEVEKLTKPFGEGERQIAGAYSMATTVPTLYRTDDTFDFLNRNKLSSLQFGNAQIRHVFRLNCLDRPRNSTDKAYLEHHTGTIFYDPPHSNSQLLGRTQHDITSCLRHDIIRGSLSFHCGIYRTPWVVFDESFHWHRVPNNQSMTSFFQHPIVSSEIKILLLGDEFPLSTTCARHILYQLHFSGPTSVSQSPGTWPLPLAKKTTWTSEGSPRQISLPHAKYPHQTFHDGVCPHLHPLSRGYCWYLRRRETTITQPRNAHVLFLAALYSTFCIHNFPGWSVLICDLKPCWAAMVVSGTPITIGTATM